jgi:hypothetical protein
LIWAISRCKPVRIIFDFVREKGKKEDDIFLIEIGTHDEVYWSHYNLKRSSWLGVSRSKSNQKRLLRP